MSGSQILVVDDTPELLRLLGAYLPRYGHTVKCCSSAAEALSALGAAEAPFHLAILDLHLPDMHGRDLAGRILDGHPDMRVLIASGAVFEAASLGPEHASRAAVLQKPYVPKALVQAIDDLLKPV